MSVFESGEGKEWFETALADRLLPNSDEFSGAEYERAAPSTVSS